MVVVVSRRGLMIMPRWAGEKMGGVTEDGWTDGRSERRKAWTRRKADWGQNRAETSPRGLRSRHHDHCEQVSLYCNAIATLN